MMSSLKVKIHQIEYSKQEFLAQGLCCIHGIAELSVMLCQSQKNGEIRKIVVLSGHNKVFGDT